MKVRYILLLLLPTTLLSSCVRDEFMPCPPLQINLTVKDKNYFNVDKVDMEQRVDENLAFREYVPTLHYMLRDAATEQVVAERSLFDVEGDEKDFAITFPEETSSRALHSDGVGRNGRDNAIGGQPSFRGVSPRND